MTDINLFDYNLPEELIAQYPAAARDSSRLLVVDRATGRTEDKVFSDLPDYLRVSVGTPEENTLFLSRLKEALL